MREPKPINATHNTVGISFISNASNPESTKLITLETPFSHSRGYLVHYEIPGSIQHVTIHLADSMPKETLMRLEAKINDLRPKKRDVERRRRIEQWRNAGYGSCVLGIPEIAKMVQDSILFFEGSRYRLFAWVIMPNHLHILFEATGMWTVAKIVASWKKFTARKIFAYKNAQRIRSSKEKVLRESDLNAIQHRQNRNSDSSLDPVWQREYWDRYIRNEKHLAQTIVYIHQNPVKAGLIKVAEDWQWSSARDWKSGLRDGRP